MIEKEQLKAWLEQAGISENIDLAVFLFGISLLVLISYAIYWLSRLLIIRGIHRLLRRAPDRWYEGLVNTGLFKSIANLFPVVFLNLTAPQVFINDYESWLEPFYTGLNIYLVWAIVGIVMALSNVCATVYEYSPRSREIPITGPVQVLKLVTVLIGIIISIAVLMDKSPMYLLSGIGALTAVIILVFRDTLMGFVAGIQLASNRMVAIGDWIEMSSHNVDGVVQEIGLISVKVENWDKTVVFLPTYALVHQSFKNWQGMVLNEGRRMRRSIPLDTSSICTLNDEELDAICQEQLSISASEWLKKHELNTPLSNVTAFRYLALEYIQNHPQVKTEFTHMVRLLEPTAAGLPLEIYAFSKKIEWVPYEGIQSDILEHLYALLPAFKLRSFQYLNPPLNQASGGDKAD
ncbi:MAG: mechanosensitive ion channel family protein [Idiomarina sp.]